MTTKLTLTIEEDVIKIAKSYAQKKGRSLSSLVENYLKTLTDKETASQKLSPKIKRLKGSIKLPEGVDYKDLMQKAIEEKYSR